MLLNAYTFLITVCSFKISATAVMISINVPKKKAAMLWRNKMSYTLKHRLIELFSHFSVNDYWRN
jgi:hypothetical protein